MSLALERFPPDILANITGRLSAHEQNLLLSRCGCHALRRRLIEHGIAHVTLPESWVTQRGFEWLSSLRGLLSVSVRLGELPSAAIRKLITSLPPTLAHLDLTYCRVPYLLISSEFETDPSLSDYTANGRRSWNVSASFPHLLSLTLASSGSGGYDMHTGENDELGPTLGPLFYNGFLSHLPQSLQYLEIDGIGEWQVLGGLWNALPPSLTCFGGHLHDTFPTKDMPESLLQSLRSMRLDLISSKSLFRGYEDDDIDLDEMPSKNLEPVASLHLISIPPKLTRLSLSGCEQFESSTFPTLPSTLTTLTLNSERLDLAQFFALIPQSVTLLDMDVDSDDIVAVGSVFTRESVQPKPNLRQICLSAHPLPETENEFYNLVLLSFPKLQACSIDGQRIRGMEAHHLELLDPSRLKILHVSLTPGVASKACQMLPKLASVSIQLPNGCKTLFFDSSTPTPSLTTVMVSGGVMPFTELVKLPHSVTRFHTQLMLSRDDAECFAHHYVPYDPTSELSIVQSSTQADHSPTTSSSSLAPAEPQKMVFSNSFNFRRLDDADRSFVVYPSPEMGYGTISYNALFHPALFPKTITELRFMKRDDVPVINAWCNPESLPNLRKLCMWRLFPHSLDVGGFTRLESIHSGGISSSCTSRCPPNLTSLKARQELQLPTSFIPLPNSMRKIRSALSFQPLSALPADCSNMVTFATFGLSNANKLPEILAKLPQTLMTHLGFRLVTHHGSGMPLAFPLPPLPRLAVIELSSECSFNISSLSLLHGVNDQVKVKGGYLASFRPLDLLINLAGGLTIGDDGSIVEAAIRAVKKAFPRHETVKSEWNSSPPSLPLDSATTWPLVAPFIPPTLTELNLNGCIFTGEDDILGLMPKGLTRLRIPEGHNGISMAKFYAGLSRFPNLTDLAYADHQGLWHLQKIPLTVKRLELEAKEPISRKSFAKLPKSVTHLKLHHLGVDASFLNALPPSVTILESFDYEHYLLTPETIKSLPATLKILTSVGGERPGIQEAFKSKGMIWAGPVDRDGYQRL